MISESIDAAEELAIGIDIGRTKIAAAVVNTLQGRILESKVLPAPPHAEPESVARATSQVARALLKRFPNVSALGVGTPEIVEWPSGWTLPSPGNERGFPLRTYLEEALDTRTVVDSDANVATWAEFRYGPGDSHSNMALLTVGTGIGAGFIIDKALYRGTSGFAGEVGHMVVQPDGARCACGNAGCLEALASGSALSRAGRVAAEVDPGGKIATLAGEPSLVTGELVYRAAEEGDPVAGQIFERLGF